MPVGLIVVALLAFVGTITVAAVNLRRVSPAPVIAEATRFDGRYLLAASDADMIATAYADGILRQIPGDRDTLSVIDLPLIDASARVTEIPASNSVTSWPQIIAVAPSGEVVYVVETAGRIDDTVGVLPIDQFPPGRTLTVVDISGGADAADVATVDVADGVSHVAVSSDGAYLAIGAVETGRQLVILPTATLDDRSTFGFFPIFDVEGAPADEVSSVFWHPSGEFLAVGINAREIQFYRVHRGDDGAFSISHHGERIIGGYAVTYGQFTSDGRFYLTSEINWNRLPPPVGNLINPPSEMWSIRFDRSEAAAHKFVSRIPVGQSAESFAINAAEDLVVTVNMGRTYLPDALSFWPGARMNSLSLLTFDRETGELTQAINEYGFEGALPEAAMFDTDGDSLAVVIYNDHEDPMGPGAIEFWNVPRDGGEPRLERTAVRLPVVRGVHSMNFIP